MIVLYENFSFSPFNVATSHDSIYYFEHFIDEFMFSVQESSFENLFKETNEFKLKLDESMEYFSKIFLKTYYKIPEKYSYWII